MLILQSLGVSDLSRSKNFAMPSTSFESSQPLKLWVILLADSSLLFVCAIVMASSAVASAENSGIDNVKIKKKENKVLLMNLFIVIGDIII